jgi:DNA invertase Pin-like site-specific DNA recombinase
MNVEGNENLGLNDHTVAPQPTDASIGVFFYGRASKDPSGMRSSVTTQESKYRDLLKINSDWTELGRFIDNDVSASKNGVRRPEFERMMKQVGDGDRKPDLIVAYDVSRLMRSRRDKIRLEQLIEAGIHLYDMRYRIDTRDKIGRIVFGIMAEMAIDRAQELAEYQRDYHERRRAAGKPAMQARGTGYTQISNEDGKVIRFEVEPQYEKSIRWAVKRLREGASLQSVTDELNDPESPHHIKPRDAERFSPTIICKIVCSARIAGCVDRQTTDKAGNLISLALVPNTDGTLPAIVTAEDVLALRERFRTNGLLRANGSGVGRSHKYLLSGIGECDLCRKPLYGVHHSNGTYAYQCMACRRSGGKGCGPSILLPVLDEIVTGATFARLRSGALTTLLAQAAAATKEVEGIAKHITFEEAELQRFEELVASGEGISPERYLSYTGAKETRIASLRSKLVQALASSPESLIPTLPNDLVENIEAYWEKADLPWRRQLVRLCFERIVLRMSNRRGRYTPAQALERIVLVPRGASGVDEAGLLDADDLATDDELAA